MEVWKDIKGYEGLYKVSNLGRVKRIRRSVTTSRRTYILKERILSQSDRGHGYLRVTLSKNKVEKTKQVHQLVAESFLNHKTCGMKKIVNHINLNKKDNKLENLEILNCRQNVHHSLDKTECSSKYIGVSKRKDRKKKWSARIMIKGKEKHLGYFYKEYDAHLAYQKALKLF